MLHFGNEAVNPRWVSHRIVNILYNSVENILAPCAKFNNTAVNTEK